MIIAIDGNEANVENRVGTSVYTTQLLEYFHKHATTNTRFVIYLKSAVQPHMPLENPYFQYRVIGPSIMWSRITLPTYLNLNRSNDVFFAPAHYAPPRLPIPLVVTIHDLSYFNYPQDFLKKDLYKLTRWTESSINRAASIIAVSECTKNDIIAHYPDVQDRIKVIYNGFEKKVSQSLPQLPPELISHPYILNVNTLQPRKNIQTLIRAFSVFRKSHDSYRLVITGRRGWLYEDLFKLVTELDLLDHVIFTGHVSDDEQATLYKQATCFVMPSLYEGFGMPILEAMSHDCPVISSNKSSLPEVGGDAALYFDPQSTDELVNCIQKLTSSTSLRRTLIERGRRQVKKFSWEICGRATLETIKAAAKRR